MVSEKISEAWGAGVMLMTAGSNAKVIAPIPQTSCRKFQAIESHQALRNSTARYVFSQGLDWERDMPIILWLLGAPIGLIIVLWLLHVI
jgi:hypothetical protein